MNPHESGRDFGNLDFQIITIFTKKEKLKNGTDADTVEFECKKKNDSVIYH